MVVSSDVVVGVALVLGAALVTGAAVVTGATVAVGATVDIPTVVVGATVVVLAGADVDVDNAAFFSRDVVVGSLASPVPPPHDAPTNANTTRQESSRHGRIPLSLTPQP